MRTRALATVALSGLSLALAVASPADAFGKRHGWHHGKPVHHRPTAPSGPPTFSFGQLQAETPGKPGCGSNPAGEPAIHVSRANLVGLGSEDGLGGGSEF